MTIHISLVITVFVSIVLLASELMVSADETSTEPVTFAFVVDTTASMGEDIDSVREGVKKIIDENMREIEGYIVVQFNDPYVKPPFQSSDTAAVKEYLDRITLDSSRNDDCPELAMAGLLEAIKVSKRNSFVFLFSDASPKDYYRYEEVIQAATAKGLKIYMMLTGCCEDCSEDDHYDVYQNIERRADAKLYRTQKSEVKTFMNYLHTVSTTDLKKLRAPPKTIEEVEEIAEHGIPSTAKPTTTSTATTDSSLDRNLTALNQGYAVRRNEAPKSLISRNVMSLIILAVVVVRF